MPRPVESSKVARPKPVESSKVARQKPVKSSKVARPRPVESSKVPRPKPVESSKVARPRPVDSSKVARPRPVESRKVEVDFDARWHFGDAGRGKWCVSRSKSCSCHARRYSSRLERESSGFPPIGPFTQLEVAICCMSQSRVRQGGDAPRGSMRIYREEHNSSLVMWTVVQQTRELRRTLIPRPSGYVGTSSRTRVLHRKTGASLANYNRPCDRADIRQRLRVHLYCFSDFASRTSCPSLLLFGLRVHLYYFSDSMSTFTAFRTSRPGLRVHLYCFPDFALRIQDFVSIFTAFRTPCPPLLLFGLRVHLFCFPDFASIFTAFRTSRPGLRVHLYCFSDSVSTFSAFRTSRPSLLLFGLRVQDFVSIFTAFRTSSPGLCVHFYCFSDSESHLYFYAGSSSIISILRGRVPSSFLCRAESRLHLFAGPNPVFTFLQGGVPSLLFCRAESCLHFSAGPNPVFTFMRGRVPSLIFWRAESRLHFYAWPSLVFTFLQGRVPSSLLCRAESRLYFSAGPSPGRVPSLLFNRAESRLHFYAGPSPVFTLMHGRVPDPVTAAADCDPSLPPPLHTQRRPTRQRSPTAEKPTAHPRPKTSSSLAEPVTPPIARPPNARPRRPIAPRSPTPSTHGAYTTQPSARGTPSSNSGKKSFAFPRFGPRIESRDPTPCPGPPSCERIRVFPVTRASSSGPPSPPKSEVAPTRQHIARTTPLILSIFSISFLIGSTVIFRVEQTRTAQQPASDGPARVWQCRPCPATAQPGPANQPPTFRTRIFQASQGGHSQAALYRRAHACPDEMKFECAHSGNPVMNSAIVPASVVFGVHCSFVLLIALLCFSSDSCFSSVVRAPHVRSFASDCQVTTSNLSFGREPVGQNGVLTLVLVSS
ncbi:hypothetical protein CRG98_023688 [Punica granatum]|uniref:Uncharacterized protein n=1 Tax=Punica granatum TaxID=22663 RepID=A0A2I0JI31_PUNGR|nr:hypothetical protein CRG98_023688 [Punica granatum]